MENEYESCCTAEDEHFDYIGQLPIGVAGPPQRLVWCTYKIHTPSGRKVKVMSLIAARWAERFSRFVDRYTSGKPFQRDIDFNDPLSMKFFGEWCMKQRHPLNIDAPDLLKTVYHIDAPNFGIE